MNQQNSVYRFGEFRLDVGRRLLFKNEELIALPPKALEILQFLIENRGRVVGKDELMQAIWQDSFVEDNNLTVNMASLRKALGEKRGENKFIATIPRRGYQLVSEVSEEENHSKLNETEISEQPYKTNVESETTEHIPVSAQISPEKINNKSQKGLLISSVAALILIACIGLVYWNFASRKIDNPNQIQTLAVLPFKPLVMTEQDAIFGMGMADALISKLSVVKRVTVRPTSAIVKYAAQKKDLTTIGEELGVDALLEGNIQRTGDKLRVSVQLIRVSDNSSLWAETFDAKESDIFVLQDSISSQVADSLAFKLNDAERQQINKHSTDNPEAYKLYLNGIYQLNKRTLETANRAISYFEQAIEKQPDYAMAYAGLGDAYIMLGNQEALLGGLSPRINIPKAKIALTKALSLDSSLSEAYASMAWVSIWETGDAAIATQDIHRALELNPNSVNAHHYNALLLMVKAEFDQSLSELQKAKEIDQFSLVVNVNMGTVLLRQKRYDEAEAQCRKTLELDANFPRTHWVLGLILEQRGKYDEAIASFQRAIELSKNGTLAKASLAHAYAKQGKRAEAEKILNELIAKSSENYIAPDTIAIVYTALGKNDEAFAYLEKALDERQFSMFQLGIEQRYDELRNDPRFQKIIDRVKEKRGDL